MMLPAVGWPGRDSRLIPVEDYARYDQIITGKFLHSETQLVLFERKTATQISPEQEGPLTSVSHKQEYFDERFPSNWFVISSQRIRSRQNWKAGFNSEPGIVLCQATPSKSRKCRWHNRS
jgi:hypothetical protein